MSFRSPKTSPTRDNHIELEESSSSNQYLDSPQIKPPLKRQVSIGSLWTSEISLLKACGTAFEIATCLRRIEELLQDIDKIDRIKFCKSDFELALNELHQNDIFFTDKLIRSISIIKMKYFNECLLWMIPDILMQEIFLMIPIDEISKIFSVCTTWKELATSDIIWKTHFTKKFLIPNPNSLPQTITTNYWTLFRDRLNDPQVGDNVEVAWRGKFRLESQDVYQGLAWWIAKVVERNNPVRYKIHYPGWEARWDEWVERRRLRWTTENDIETKLRPSDRIELWCCGFNVPGAWLETTIKKIRHERYAVMRSQTTGIVWVDRDRIRPRRRKTSSSRLTESSELTNHSSILSTVSVNECLSHSRCNIM